MVKLEKSEVKISKDVFAQAAEKNAEIILDCHNYAWKFTGLTKDNAVELKSAKIDINANVDKVDNVLNTAEVDTNATTTVSFEHDGPLPGTAEVTISVTGRYSDGRELFFYYFNEAMNAFELVSKNKVVNGNVTVTLTHCSDYVFSEKELPAGIVIAASTGSAGNTGSTGDTGAIRNENVGTAETGDNSPIVLYAVFALISAMVLAGYAVYDYRRKRSLS